MYSPLPRRHRLVVQATLASAWMLTAFGGFAAIFWTPTTIESELGTYLTYTWGAIAAVAALCAAVGVAVNRYRWEWIAAWFAAGGLSLYALVVWYLVATGTPTRLAQAAFVTALVMHTLTRVALCAAHAAKLRREAAQEGTR